MAAENVTSAAIDSGNNPSRAWVVEVSGNYFDVLEIQPYLGRFFHGADERGSGSAPYIVLSHSYWHSHFQDDPGVIGRSVQINKRPFTILGVAQPGFNGSLLIFRPDFWIPITNEPQAQLTDRGSRWVTGVVVRLKPGVTTQEASADLNGIRLDLNRAYPKDDQSGLLPHVSRSRRYFLGPSITAFVAGLMLLAGLILLAACANLGSLFAARAPTAPAKWRCAWLSVRGDADPATALHGSDPHFALGGAAGLWGSVLLL